MYRMAFALSQIEDWEHAESFYRSILTIVPEDGNTRVGLAEVLWAQGKETEAINVLLTLPSEQASFDPACLRAMLDTPYLSALSDEQRNRLVRLVAQLLLAVYEADREGDDRGREDHAQPS